jgi:lon-related putative ATP-dependent protease
MDYRFTERHSLQEVKMTTQHRSLSVEEVYRACDERLFDFQTTADLPPAEGIIGQKRAVRAIHFGLDIRSRGYNLYLAGPPGTGRTSLIRNILRGIAKDQPVPGDICLVNNFREPDRPRVLYLKAGLARQLKKDVDSLIDGLRREIPLAFESKNYEAQQTEIVQHYQQQSTDLLGQLESEASQMGIMFRITPTGVVTRVVKDGQPLSQEEYEQLHEREKQEIRQRIERFNQRVIEVMDQVRDAERETREKAMELERQTAAVIVQSHIGYLKRRYAEHAEIVEYLEELQGNILENSRAFRKQEDDQQSTAKSLDMMDQPAPFVECQVNILVDNSQAQGAPVIFESNPSYVNLFGAIEREVRFGALVTNFTMVKAGSLVQANGGYLVVEASDLFQHPFVWDQLKRSLESSEVRIEDVAAQYGAISATGLRPEPIKVNVKVILIGNSRLHYLLYAYEEDFKKLFKVKADFDFQMDRNDENTQQYAQFVKACGAKDGLMPFDRSGVAALVEYGSRLAGDQAKLSTQFGEIADIMNEASYWAAEDNGTQVVREHVEKAIDEKIYRSNRIEEYLQEMITRGHILVDTEGAVPGQVNGLSVIGIGDYEFGRPVRITCQTFAGKTGVVSIERRAKLSGNIHNKAIMILEGYLGAKFAQEKPLTLAASLGFEQTYDMIEGDSASIAETVAMLSSLSGVPVKQHIAVTGSINQKGQVQPIGGVNEKVEGFFEVCKARGLNGHQGVIIPYQNVTNLMLKKEVREAIDQGKFHIYPVATVDEAIAILTGAEAGERDADGNFKEGTVNFLVEKRLKELTKEAKAAETKEDEEGE